MRASCDVDSVPVAERDTRLMSRADVCVTFMPGTPRSSSA
jgi:hypothetical protein